MSSARKHFYDAAAPENIPTGVLAAIYINGYKWSQRDIDRMARIFAVSVHPEAYWARLARCIDVEKGAAQPEDVVPFIRERRAFLSERYGPHFEDDSTAYVNRSNLDTVFNLVFQAGIPQPRYWIATLDGTWYVEHAWAVQGQGGPNAHYDLSVILGTDDLHRP